MGSGNQIPSLYSSKLWNPFPGAFEPSSRIMSGSLWTLCSALCLHDSAGASCESPVLSSNTFSTMSKNTWWCMIACPPLPCWWPKVTSQLEENSGDPLTMTSEEGSWFGEQVTKSCDSSGFLSFLQFVIYFASLYFCHRLLDWFAGRGIPVRYLGAKVLSSIFKDNW